MAASNKIERAWTSQNVKALECAMISKLGSDINSIDEADIQNINKVPLEVKLTESWGRRIDLEKSIFKIQTSWSKKLLPKLKKP